MNANAILREPTKPETRIGWWFMRRFRRAESARRSARNEVMAASWLMVLAYDDWAKAWTPDAGERFAAARDRLCRAFDAYDGLSSPDSDKETP